MKTGLTLGKYAPLHRGHQFIIEKALEETDHLYVIIYDSPEVTSIPLTVRANWIRQLYPQAEVIEAWDGPAEVGDTPEIKRLQEDYIHQTLAERKVTHFFSSEFYGDHVSRSLNAIDVRVDPDRTNFPVSATMIRNNPYEQRQYLDPIVYRDLITWISFLGAPSTGKTTLCSALAKRLNTTWMPEYGREYWEKHQHNRRLSPEQLLDIAVGHRIREDALVTDARKVLCIDTDASTTALFSKSYHGTVLNELEALADEATKRYDLCFLCCDDIPYENTWDRSGEAHRKEFQQSIIEDLNQRRRKFIPLRGTLAERIEQALGHVRNFEKWPAQ